MKEFFRENINTPEYWDTHQTALDFGLRQETYSELAGRGERILELGCGLSPFLSKSLFKYKTGLDFSPKTIERARLIYPNVEYFVGDATKTEFLDNQFDVVVAGEIIEHLKNPESLIQEMIRLAKERIIISTPILEFDDPEHLREFDEGWFKDRNFQTKTIESERFPGRSYIFAWREKL